MKEEQIEWITHIFYETKHSSPFTLEETVTE